ncbi:Siroheme synthase [termite gut metagenome]|uniref:precorrin-2 dehydrogenase n=1 Tax=termite gut metagenome TaxID=433724 RepID=A0A5J4RKL2_9ZZZZ
MRTSQEIIMNRETLTFLPVSVNITHKKIVLIGGGKVAFHKASILSGFTDTAMVIAPEFHPGFYSLPFTLVKKRYDSEDLEDAFLVYICTERKELNALIKAECEKRNILANVCDTPMLCDFISPAVHKDGNITISVSSNAQNVRQSITIRNRIKTLVEEGVIEIS